MAGATEIYICKPGQSLDEGRLEYSQSVTTKAQAEIDANRRCVADKTIGRIAYYAVDDNGRFRSFYSYENPDAPKPRQSPSFADFDQIMASQAAADQRKPGLLRRLRTFFEES